MFYENNLLARRGKFGVIWIAATRPTGLKKRDYVTVNVRQQCHNLMDHILHRPIRVKGRSGSERGIAENEEPQRFSLYLSAKLMYGVVKVFAQQHIFLLEDVNSAMITVSFHRGRITAIVTGAGAGAAGNHAGLNLNDDAAIELRNTDEADLLLLQHINTPFALNMLPAQHFEVTTDLETHHMDLTPPEQNPLNAPIDESAHGGMLPIDPFELLGIRTDDVFNEPNHMNEPFVMIAESDQFNADYGNILGDGKQNPPQEPQNDQDGPVIPVVNDENEPPKDGELAAGRRRAKAKANRIVITDNIENVSQSQSQTRRVSLVNYPPENRFGKHNFAFKTNWPTHGLNIDPSLAAAYFANRTRVIQPAVEMELIQYDGVIEIPTISEGQGPLVNQSLEEARAGSVRSNTSSLRISNLLKEQKKSKGNETASTHNPRMTDVLPPEFEEPPQLQNLSTSFVLPLAPIDSTGSFSRRSYGNPLIEDPVAAIRDWLATSEAGEEEKFSTFCPIEATKAQAADAFIALMFHSKKGRVTLRQEESYSEIFFKKIAN